MNETGYMFIGGIIGTIINMVIAASILGIGVESILLAMTPCACCVGYCIFPFAIFPGMIIGIIVGMVLSRK